MGRPKDKLSIAVKAFYLVLHFSFVRRLNKIHIVYVWINFICRHHASVVS
jgi:hypothetical protein